MSNVLLEQADRIADEALRQGRERGYAPLTVAIMDAGGHLVVLKRADNSGIMRPQLAMAKAWGVLGMGLGGRELARRSQGAPVFFAALNAISEGRLAPVAGGALIRDAAGHVVGSIGISGDTSDNDELCLIPAVQSAGLTPDTGDPL
ncbi:GlcG protein [Bordetella genomosp. 8]|uniref:GlcG protein n=1 Tax=Bordetella genomosp. 8 TaxID=1416806 RepID=A0A1W6YHM1_9BORD|nr:heme-binding protein [Bordetella genomosp. 8]ARP80596.1 GlcG protein [Bordetella genomosp. 8]